MKSREELELIAKSMRADVFKMALNSGTKGAHIGGSMSSIEILAALYGDVMHIDPQNLKDEKRDRFIMSKAHSAIGLYAALHFCGLLNDEDIDSALQGRAELYKHPRLNIEKGFEFSGGSLGQGLGQGAGSALALRMKGNLDSKIYVLLGDGECDEGSVWEAASFIAHYNLTNLITILDMNGLQNDGPTQKVSNPGDMSGRWKCLGFEAIEVDGHDVVAVRDALNKDAEKPKIIIAHTIKGKGVSFAENDVNSHIFYFTKDMYDQAMEELV